MQVKIEDNELAPRIMEGDTALIDSRAVRPGDLVILKDGSGRYVCRKAPEYRNVRQPAVLIGRVKEIRATF